MRHVLKCWNEASVGEIWILCRDVALMPVNNMSKEKKLECNNRESGVDSKSTINTAAADGDATRARATRQRM